MRARGSRCSWRRRQFALPRPQSLSRRTSCSLARSTNRRYTTTGATNNAKWRARGHREPRLVIVVVRLNPAGFFRTRRKLSPGRRHPDARLTIVGGLSRLARVVLFESAWASRSYDAGVAAPRADEYQLPRRRGLPGWPPPVHRRHAGLQVARSREPRRMRAEPGTCSR
jgi:hypothetical protein